jgi:hypothetical protein
VRRLVVLSFDISVWQAFERVPTFFLQKRVYFWVALILCFSSEKQTAGMLLVARA